jgi:hypothetical protein
MLCRQFHSLQADLQWQLRLAQTTHVHCWTTRKWCAGVTIRMANLVKETWTALAMELGQPLLQHQRSM